MAPIAGHKRSKVWNYFSDEGACKYCPKTVKNLKVSNLWRHIRIAHKSEIVGGIQESMLDDDVHMQNADSELAAYMPGKHERREVTSTLKLSKIRATSPPLSTWSCSTVPEVCVMKEDCQSKRITDALMFMIAKDNLSTTHSEGIGFKNFMKTINKSYTIPDHRALCLKLGRKYEAAIVAKKELLSGITNVALTIDIRTDAINATNLISFTGHFVHDLQMKSELLGLKPVSEFNSRRRIKQVIINILTEWGLSLKKVVACVSDSASKITKEICEAFPTGKTLPCFAHHLHLVIQEALHEEVSPDVALIIERVRTIMTFFKENSVAAEVLRNNQKHADLRPLKLRRDPGWECRKQWKSCFLMMERFVEISEHVAAVLNICSEAPQMLSEQELFIVKDVLKLLRPFMVINDDVGKKQFTPRTLLIPLVFCLKNELPMISVDTDSGRAFKDKVIRLVNHFFVDVESNALNALATLLDPRFKNVSFENSGCCGKAVNLLDHEMKNATDANSNVKVESGSKESGDLQSLWKFHDERSANLSLNQTLQPGLAAVVKQYLSTPTVPRSVDPLVFWQQNQFVYPALCRLASKYLCIPASSWSQSERPFNQAEDSASKKRTNIDESRVEKMLIIGSMSLEDWGKLR